MYYKYLCTSYILMMIVTSRAINSSKFVRLSNELQNTLVIAPCVGYYMIIVELLIP